MFPSKSLAIFLTNGILLTTSCFLVPRVLAEPIAVDDKHTRNFPEITDSSACSSFTPAADSLNKGENDTESTATAIATPSPEAGIDNAFISHPSCNTQPIAQASAPAIAQENSQQNPSSSDNSSSSSKEFAPQSENPAWRFSIMPYATIPINIYGTNIVKGNQINYSAGLGTILQYLQIAVSGRAEAWYGNLGLIADGYYTSLAGTGFEEYTRPPGLRATLVSNLTFIQGIYDFALTYHLGATPVAFDPKKPSNQDFPLIWFEPIVGTRLNQIDSTIKTTLSFDRLPLVLENSFSKGRTWFEPLIGGKLGLQVSDPLTLWLRGDASGFGLAGQTNISWNIFFGADWWVNRSLSLSLSYRFYEIDYGNGTGDNAFRFNENFNGPTLAATFHF